MDSDQLSKILDSHQKWLSDEEGGERANLWDANLRGANLRGANLRGANLEDANLEDANLWGANGNLKEIKSIFLEQYPVVYTSEYLQIGCERHKISDWWDFDGERILKMDGRAALKFWRKLKDHIKQSIDLSPAVATAATQES